MRRETRVHRETMTTAEIHASQLYQVYFMACVAWQIYCQYRFFPEEEMILDIKGEVAFRTGVPVE